RPPPARPGAGAAAVGRRPAQAEAVPVPAAGRLDRRAVPALRGGRRRRRRGAAHPAGAPGRGPRGRGRTGPPCARVAVARGSGLLTWLLLRDGFRGEVAAPVDQPLPATYRVLRSGRRV